MLATIEAYEAQLSEDPASLFPACCPACLEAGTLRVHELRPRGFWCCLLNQVERVASTVLRVACRVCDSRTTVLPAFALPHKRYVASDLIDASQRYLLDDEATHESATKVEGRPVFHSTMGATRARSTVHRWITFLGSLTTILGNGTELAKEADVTFSPLAEMLHVSKRRYRTDARCEVLGRAHLLLRVRSRLARALKYEIFPTVATREVWR